MNAPPAQPTGARQGSFAASGRRRLMARDLGELNREDYARYKDDVKKEGKAFFPFAMWHDTVMGFVVVVVIIAPRGHLVLRRGRRRAGNPRALVHGAGRSGDDGLRPAARLVLLLPLLPPPDLRVAGDGLHRDRRHPDDLPHPPDRAAVLRPAPRAAAVAPARRHGRRRADRDLDGRPHLEGRDGEGGARLRAHPPRPRVGGGARLRRQRAGGAGGGALRAVGLPQLPHVHGPGGGQPRRSRPDGGRPDERRRVLRPLPDEPRRVREHGHGLVRVPRPGEPRGARRVPRGLEGRRDADSDS